MAFIIGVVFGVIMTAYNLSIKVIDQPMDVKQSDIAIIRQARDSIENQDYKTASYYVKSITKEANKYRVVFDGDCDELLVNILGIIEISHSNICMDPAITIELSK